MKNPKTTEPDLTKRYVKTAMLGACKFGRILQISCSCSLPKHFFSKTTHNFGNVPCAHLVHMFPYSDVVISRD